jgi:hypothetical protein
MPPTGGDPQTRRRALVWLGAIAGSIGLGRGASALAGQTDGTQEMLRPLSARHEIYAVLCRYCRALDRMDKDMAYAVWHPDATVLYHGLFTGGGHAFVDWVWRAHESMERHSHQIANTLIHLDGDTATSEAYVTVTLWTNPDDSGEQLEIIGKGRYLDRWSRRNGTWAIDHREYVVDLQTITTLNRGNVTDVSRRDKQDPSFRFLA